MSTKRDLMREAEQEADRFFDSLAKNAVHEAAELIGDAIDFRRYNPCYFARVRRNMVRLLEKERPRLWKARVRWHNRWRRRYEARCDAEHELLATKCRACEAATVPGV